MGAACQFLVSFILDLGPTDAVRTFVEFRDLRCQRLMDTATQTRVPEGVRRARLPASCG